MSRDPGRIDPLLEKFRSLWHRFPDMRFGQVVSNIAPRGRDPFFPEDDEWDAAITEASKRWGA